MHSAVCVRGLSKGYRSGSRARAISTPALREVSLDISRGEIVGIVGRAGAGKSTLLLCLSGLLRADEGSITWFGEQLTAHHLPPGLAYVPQRAGYYSFLSVREALEYYATLHDLSSASRASQVESALREVSLHLHATRRVSSLPSTMVQRLGLAQALIGDPRGIMLDETLCGEGLLFEPDIVSLLTRLSQRGITIIVAAPNPVEVHRVAARIIKIVDGRVVTSRPESIASGSGPEGPPFELPSIPPRLVAEQG
ncbi:MAG: ABC transporter ATP-binding protein [Gemmatimonadota bacterium]|nr:ABC transporter ATP-binding protein [Gemmatimonadota bacterium]